MFFRKPAVDLLVVGLGNPGNKYQNTRHNAGFILLDEMAKKLSAPAPRLKWEGLYNQVPIGGKKVLLLKPQTYMNNSGKSVNAFASYYKLPPEKVLVVFDDVSLPVGKMRIRRGGSAGGHNGIKDIAFYIGDDFPRFKVGVGGKPHPDYDMADWVLSKFSPKERQTVENYRDSLIDTVELLLKDNITEAMNRYN